MIIMIFRLMVLATILFEVASARGGQILAPWVFQQPTPDMVDVSQALGIPFGGIGTGFSVFGKYGFVWVSYDLQRLNSLPLDGPGGKWKVTEAPKTGPTFAWQLTEGNQRIVLQETPVTWLTNAAPVDKVCAYAFLPKGYFRFEKTGLDLQLNMTAFSPMIPHDLTNSTIPVQVFEFTLKNKSSKPRNLTLALLDQETLKVLGKYAILEDQTGTLAFGCDGGIADSQGIHKILKLAPGQDQTVRFYIAWNYPVITTASPAMPQHYRPYYTRRFANAEQVIDLAKKSADQWSAAIDLWHNAYQVPAPFKRLWFSSLSSVISSTSLTDDPYFFEREMPHNWMNTMDVCVYCDWLYLVNWPELELMDMNQFLKVIPQSGENAGFVWHSLWNDNGNYAEEPTFIGRAYRDSLWFNDQDWALAAFPTLELAANRAYHADHYDYLLNSVHGNQSYDLWMMPGISAYVNVMWVYALYSLDQMSQNLHQPATIDGVPAGTMLIKARESLDHLLWNQTGNYWNTFYVPTNHNEEPGSFAKTDAQDTFSDQLFGKWVTLIDPHAETVLPANKVSGALNAVFVNNLIDDPAKGFRGWVNGMKPGHKPEFDAGTHSRDCWFGPQEAMASLFADAGDEAKSLDIFNSLESSLHNDELYVGEWNKSIAPDGTSRTQPDEPHKDTPRFPPYPRYKSCWEYLVAILGLKMDTQNFYLNPFKTIDFGLNNVELAGTHFTINVQSGWTKIIVDGKPQTGPLQLPRNHRAYNIQFLKD